MSRDPAIALRESAIVTRRDDLCYLRLIGADARRLADYLCAGTLRLRDGQMQHVLLLDDDATCFADAFLLCDDDAYLLIAEGQSPETLLSHIARNRPANLDVEVEDLSRSCAIISIDGPFSWELVSRVVGAEMIGLPYLTFFQSHGGMCYRAGTTGEFGYGLVVQREAAGALEEQLLSLGVSLDVERGTVELLHRAGVENFFFDIAVEGRTGATPIELQLQWRVNHAKQAVGMDALRLRRAAGISQRLTCLTSRGPVEIGDRVFHEGADVGSVVNATMSVSRHDWVILALIRLSVAHPRINFAIGAGLVRARSVAPPVLNNRSLFVSPQMHSYATRGEIALPPLARA